MRNCNIINSDFSVKMLVNEWRVFTAIHIYKITARLVNNLKLLIEKNNQTTHEKDIDATFGLK